MRKIIDCDVHVRWRSLEDLAEHLEEPWRSRLLQKRIVHPHNGYPNPIATARRDASPPEGGSPGSSPAFLAKDLLDRYNMSHAILIGESSQLNISNMVNADAATALASAYNDWLVTTWLSFDSRLLGSAFAATQDPIAAAREIDRIGSHPQIIQIALGSGARMPYGQRFFYPIFEAAERNNLAIAIHPFTEGSLIANPPTAAGYPSHYIEYHTCITGSIQAHLASLVFEGVFERFPRLRVVIVEAGVAWIAPFVWRMDREWKSLRIEVPWVKRRPSEYVNEHVRFTTQPLDEPDNPDHLVQIIGMLSSPELLMFSSDYPHWDFDNPERVLERFPDDVQDQIFFENAQRFYQL
ncbi:MAG: amidohydrolase [Rhodothermia bacterium]|nr:amidohydrolase [Rhodothermia bacterium]